MNLKFSLLSSTYYYSVDSISWMAAPFNSEPLSVSKMLSSAWHTCPSGIHQSYRKTEFRDSPSGSFLSESHTLPVTSYPSFCVSFSRPESLHSHKGPCRPMGHAKLGHRQKAWKQELIFGTPLFFQHVLPTNICLLVFTPQCLLVAIFWLYPKHIVLLYERDVLSLGSYPVVNRSMEVMLHFKALCFVPWFYLYYCSSLLFYLHNSHLNLSMSTNKIVSRGLTFSTLFVFFLGLVALFILFLFFPFFFYFLSSLGSHSQDFYSALSPSLIL